MTSLLLVEDHAVFAEALVRVLHGKDNFNVVKVVDTAEKALQALSYLDVDLALVDVSLPRMSGIELVSEMQQAYPQIPCIMISGHLSRNYVRRSLEAGARGYAIKDSAAGILDGIRRVLDGEIYVSKEIQNFETPEQ
jgi:DNA-binding NarL/FixJ family response regulator